MNVSSSGKFMEGRTILRLLGFGLGIVILLHMYYYVVVSGKSHKSWTARLSMPKVQEEDTQFDSYINMNEDDGYGVRRDEGSVTRYRNEGSNETDCTHGDNIDSETTGVDLDTQGKSGMHITIDESITDSVEIVSYNFSLIQCHKIGKDVHYNHHMSLQCKRRLPQAIGIGAKKCGTGAVIFFLSSHPAVKTSQPPEVHYWDWYPNNNIDWYRNRMPVTSQFQITMEKTPSYFVTEHAPLAIKRNVSPDIKLIAILRDPVKRAISDYAHTAAMYPHLLNPRLRFKGRQPRYPYRNHTYIIKESFEKSVLKDDGEVNIENALVMTGIYVMHLERWLRVYPAQQMLVLDGEEFSKNPLPQLRTIETFLGLPKYFDKDKLYFNNDKGYYCLAKPVPKCQGAGKGRKHPDVRDEVVRKLQEFYQPYNQQLENLLDRKFSWSW